MKRLGALLVVLLLGSGCATGNDKAQWEEFWKDARGDNMKMRNDESVSNKPIERP